MCGERTLSARDQRPRLIKAARSRRKRERARMLEAGIERLDALARDDRLSGARDVILRCTGAASDLLDGAQRPFLEGRAALSGAGKALREVEAREARYLASLRALAADRPSSTKTAVR